jgi:hypothetical protein
MTLPRVSDYRAISASLARTHDHADALVHLRRARQLLPDDAAADPRPARDRQGAARRPGGTVTARFTVRRSYMNHVHTRPAVAAKIAAVVVQPRTLIARPLTAGPMIRRLLVMRMMSSISGGVEKPWTMPATTSAFIGLNPKKFIRIATIVKAAILRIRM